MTDDEHSAWAKDFMAKRPYGALLRVSPGAQAIDTNHLKEPTNYFPGEDEFISAGTFHVNGVARDPSTGRVTVDLTQVNTEGIHHPSTSSTSSTSSTPPTLLPLHILPWQHNEDRRPLNDRSLLANPNAHEGLKWYQKPIMPVVWLDEIRHPEDVIKRVFSLLKVWDSSKHPRGQPRNAGEFGPGGEGPSGMGSPFHPAGDGIHTPDLRRRGCGQGGQTTWGKESWLS